MACRSVAAFLIATLMLLSGVVVFGLGSQLSAGASAPTVGAPGVMDAGSPGLGGNPSVPVRAPALSTIPGVESGASERCPSLENVQNDPGYAAFVQRVQAFAHRAVSAGLPASDVHLPYAGPIADQTVNGVAMAGSQLSAECEADSPPVSQTNPTGVAYDGQSDVSGVRDLTLDANSVAGILTVRSPSQNFYPGSGTPTVWGAQENVVLPNVTIFGQRCPSKPCDPNGSGNYAFWVQNVISYDSHNDSLYFVDDTWNFTSYFSEMFNSSLVQWSPNGGNYTGVWVAFSPYYHIAAPFTVTAYVNTSVDSVGDQVLWYNYSIRTPTEFIGNGNYDYLVFHSQPVSGKQIKLHPPDFEASATSYHLVTEGYEFDAFIGSDDGANQLMLGANATMNVEYCVATPYCTPTHFAYANVPAAVNYGSQTGEQTIGIAVNYVGSTAYLTAGPLINHGLWNFTGEPGVEPGSIRVRNAIRVTGDPEGPLTTQPYVFVFLKNRVYADQGFQWAPDSSSWYLMPGTYRYTILLADYSEANGTLVVGANSTKLSAVLSYNPQMGVYTPLWAFGNGELAGISWKGNGSLTDQYVPFNNPTTGFGGFTPGNLSRFFFSWDDYAYPSFPGVLFAGTTAYVDLDAPPAFSVPAGSGAYYYLGLEFSRTSHLTLAHDSFVQGWPVWSEIAFYIWVPASQNPVPEAEASFWDSTNDLVLSNNFVATTPLYGAVAPDALVLYGGSHNVVWGNTFTDPIGVTPNVTGPYAGLGLGEGGDLLYNNNFSVDNPVVYLPYNWPNVADCLPQSLGGCANNGSQNRWYYNDAANIRGNTWNVRLQSASDVVHTVNGFPLRGNVLGPSVRTQGGNYYWNYGTSPNNYSTRPYVSRFYYSDWSEIYPLGCGSIQAPGAPCGTEPPVAGAYENGIAVGGDYAPYGPTIEFIETGLPYGSAWHVTIDGVRYTSHSIDLVIAEPYGNYTYKVSAPGWHAHPGHGSVLASGAAIVRVSFTPVSHAPLAGLPLTPPTSARVRTE